MFSIESLLPSTLLMSEPFMSKSEICEALAALTVLLLKIIPFPTTVIFTEVVGAEILT